MNKWTGRFLELAKLISTWSKDPSTQVGAVIVDNRNRIVSSGYNGFPHGVKDSIERYSDRDTKLRMVIHAERNALDYATREVRGCRLYVWPFSPCAQCAAGIIQKGITEVIAPTLPFDKLDLRKRWEKDLDLASQMFKEAGVHLMEIDVWSPQAQ